MRHAIILGGGSGLRAGGSIPKQFRDIHGRPLIWWSLRAFRQADPETRLVVVIHPDWISHWRGLVAALPPEERYEHTVVPGGKDRVDSVANALAAIPEAEGDLIAVHDGARCCVSAEMIERGWEAGRRHATAVPVVAVTDSLRLLGDRTDKAEKGGYSGVASKAVDRSRYVAVQTPQIFDSILLKKAYDRREPGVAYTDDASLVEPHAPIHLYEGEAGNIKVTHPRDFAIVGASS